MTDRSGQTLDVNIGRRVDVKQCADAERPERVIYPRPGTADITAKIRLTGQ